MTASSLGAGWSLLLPSSAYLPSMTLSVVLLEAEGVTLLPSSAFPFSLLFAVSSLLFHPPSDFEANATADWYNNSWEQRKKITTTFCCGMLMVVFCPCLSFGAKMLIDFGLNRRDPSKYIRVCPVRNIQLFGDF